jgi:hypothetical protein
MNEPRKPENLGTADVATAATREKQERSFGRSPTPVQPRPESRDPANPAVQLRDEGTEPLLKREELEELKGRWGTIQTEFVDEPRKALEDADRLVAEAIKRLAESFAAQRVNLERVWDRGDGVTTEDLRLTLRRYRSFFDRLLSI